MCSCTHRSAYTDSSAADCPDRGGARPTKSKPSIATRELQYPNRKLTHAQPPPVARPNRPPGAGLRPRAIPRSRAYARAPARRRHLHRSTHRGRQAVQCAHPKAPLHHGMHREIRAPGTAFTRVLDVSHLARCDRITSMPDGKYASTRTSTARSVRFFVDHTSHPVRLERFTYKYGSTTRSVNQSLLHDRNKTAPKLAPRHVGGCGTHRKHRQSRHQTHMQHPHKNTNIEQLICGYH